MSNTNESVVTCRTCKGEGYRLDRQYSRQRLYREIKRKCRFCQGKGHIVRDDRPLWQRQAEVDEAAGKPRSDLDEAIRLLYGEQ